MRKFGIALVLLLAAVAALGGTSASASLPTAVAATGAIVTVRGADLQDGDTFTIGDGVGAPVTFEFSSGAPVTPGHLRVAFASTDSAAQVKTSVISAVNTSSLAVTASSTGFALVSLVNDTADPTGNVPITENVSDSGFTVLGMSGGGGTDDGSAAAAVGTIFTVRGAYLVDGDSFTIADGAGGVATFEFSAHTVTAGDVRVGFTSADTAAQVKNSVITAVNGAALAVTASSAGSAAVSLVNDVAGPAGNEPITDNVSDPAFSVLGMSGGRDAVDQVAPADAPVVTGTSGSNGWYISDVSVAWNWSDTGSGIDPANCTQTSGTSGEGSVTASSSCRDLAGNPASDSRTFQVDGTAPVVAVTGVTNAATYPLGSVPAALCSTTDVTSGVAVPATVVITGGSNGVGGFSATCSGAVDNAGNHATPVSVRYAVVYPFTGFFAPVDNPPVVNVVGAGKAIPVSFRLGGNRGLGILAAGYPTSQSIQCHASSRTDKIERTVTATSSSLSYDARAGEYVYVWKTNKAWAHSCRQLTVRLADGTDHIAYFKLT